MNAPNLPFDDSLKLLIRRQRPIFQTGRGNYAHSWAFADFWQAGQAGELIAVPLTWKEPTFPPIDVLLFGSDVPHLTAMFYTETHGGLSPFAEIAAWIDTTNTALQEIDNWAREPGPAKPVYAGDSPPAPPTIAALDVCPSGIVPVFRPSTMAASWNATDAGQGALVITQTEQAANVQGFPVRLTVPVCADREVDTYSANARLWVGFESPINHGLQVSAPTGAGADAQPFYVPILLRRQDYTEAIRANRNVILSTFSGSNAAFVVVGLWA